MTSDFAVLQHQQFYEVLIKHSTTVKVTFRSLVCYDRFIRDCLMSSNTQTNQVQQAFVIISNNNYQSWKALLISASIRSLGMRPSLGYLLILQVRVFTLHRLPCKAYRFRRLAKLLVGPRVSLTPHLGVFINSTVSSSRSPVGWSPAKTCDFVYQLLIFKSITVLDAYV